ncbi:hypothetical protein HK405_010395, partial [Cladochytrium tenue]
MTPERSLDSVVLPAARAADDAAVSAVAGLSGLLGPTPAAILAAAAALLLLLAVAVAAAPSLIVASLVGLLAIAAIRVVLAALRAAWPVPVVNWWDETVVVTGGASGLGRELILKLLAEKKPRKIVVLDVMKHDYGTDTVVHYDCDVSKKDVVREVAKKVIEEVGQPTMLVNNAGVVNLRLFVDLTEAQIERTININVLGLMWVTKAFLPGMIKANRGHIVLRIKGLVAASLDLPFPIPTHAPPPPADYCASKAAVCGFNDALREELRSTNIKVSVINPGLISTGMFGDLKYRIPFLFPTLSPGDVSAAMVDILDRNRSTIEFLPVYAIAAPPLRGLAVEFFEIVSD